MDHCVPTFFVFQHGSHGFAVDFDKVKEQLKTQLLQQQPDEVGKYHHCFWDTHVNEGLKSDAGVLLCAQRLVKELAVALKSWLASLPPQAAGSGASKKKKPKFSCAGHSFGGLILREAIFLLWLDHAELCDQLDFAVFCTIASPHCGVGDLNWFLRVGAGLIGMAYSQTYLDMLLHNDVLTHRLVDNEHLACLEKFERRVLYGNTHKDMLVSMSSSLLFCTAPPSPSSQQQQQQQCHGTSSGCSNILWQDTLPADWLAPHETEKFGKATPANEKPSNDLLMHKIAYQIRQKMSVDVVAVKAQSSGRAHDTILGKVKIYGTPMSDVVQHVATQLAAVVSAGN